MATSSNKVCNYRAEMIHFIFTAKPKFSVSLTLFLLTLPLTFDFIHSLPPPDSPIVYLAHQCSNDSIRNGSALQRNLKVVINSVLDNVNKTGYSESSYGENGDKMFGLTQCRGDLNASRCRGCVSKAIEYLAVDCNGSYGSVLLSGCALRYATHRFSSDYNESDSSDAVFASCDNITINATEARRGVKDWKTASVLSRLIEKAVSSNIGYSTLSDHGVYSLAECWRALNMSGCNQCLNDMYDYLGSCPPGTSQGLANFDSCAIRYERYKFYDDGMPLFSALNGSGNKSGPSIPASRPTQGKGLPKVLGLSIGGAVVVVGLSIGGAVVVVVLLGLVVFWKRKVTNPSNRKPLPGCYKPPGQLSTAISKSKLNYKFEILQTATKNFDPTNKIGQGGFGSVYKGVMIDGRQIAVKRLFSNKEDNVSEFFNEVNLISCVQHKNLVKLLGCSVDGPEKLLVYEYLPNKSLDHFLFDENMGNVLDWQRRFDIILGTSCGLAYLHQGSDIRVIHRDIKASNILLDHHFKPKIADFGLVRYFSEDQTHISTGIVGTRGYMAPEYLIHGHLTEKVDVYAFGVLVLEIITGRRNKPPIHTNDIPSLLTMVWNCHLSGTVLDIIDSNIQENYQEEVLKIVHISLLCTQASATLRPSMSEVITFLTSKIQHLLEPNPPPFIDVFPLNPNTNISIAANHSQPNNNTNVSNVASSSSTSISLNTISSSSFRPR